MRFSAVIRQIKKAEVKNITSAFILSREVRPGVKDFYTYPGPTS